MIQPWETDNWFVSPWNFLEEVTKDFQLPRQVKIHDITLRDAEQQAGIICVRGRLGWGGIWLVGVQGKLPDRLG